MFWINLHFLTLSFNIKCKFQKIFLFLGRKTKAKTIFYLAKKSLESNYSCIDEVAWETCSFEFVHFWEVKVERVELLWNFAPKTWFIWLETLSNVSSIRAWISNDVGVKFSGERSSVAPCQKDGVENTHTEEVHSAWSHTSVGPSYLKQREYLEAIYYKSKRTGTWGLELRSC